MYRLGTNDDLHDPITFLVVMRMGVQFNRNALSSSTAKNLNLNHTTVFSDRLLVKSVHEMKVPRLYRASSGVAPLASIVPKARLTQTPRDTPLRTVGAVNPPRDGVMSIDIHLEEDIFRRQ